MFWLSAFCSRSRKAKLAITLIQLLAKRENSKKLKHIRLFSPSVLYPYFQQDLTNLGVLWKVQHSSLCTCPLTSCIRGRSCSPTSLPSVLGVDECLF